jgi:hypothetical protein
MKNTTTHKPIKHSAGVYSYRGVYVKNYDRLGFVFVSTPERGDWHWGGLGTLANAIGEIDAKLDGGGYIVAGGRMYHKNCKGTLTGPMYF